ncbi:hypothetical protein TrVE_jg9619 [Triparma verrucosa]|uniref:Uncharacterized protein n=1 Tax=Triparma verrucosa TaxID=1606542 RepID=A0A9W7FJP5_9STRA|nr:hypothetical protein TrVE_jg9619 [Triparma verrucosa]
MDLRRSTLDNAFGKLSLSDQYDITLTGLCSKILDVPANTTDWNTSPEEALRDPLLLIGEMKDKNIKPSSRSTRSLIDAVASLSSVDSMAKTLTLLARTQRKLKVYGRKFIETRKIQVKPDTKVPEDRRQEEILAAVSYLMLLGICFGRNALGGFDDLYDPLLSNAVIYSSLLILLGDNIYAVLKFLSGLTDKIPSLPSVPESSPVGRGELTKTLTAGLGRLGTSDTERECRSEAAALVTAYKLGLPCFAFRSNGLEAAALIKGSSEESNVDDLSGEGGIIKVLTWTLAPVAEEEMKHSQLVVSDPREAKGLWKRLNKIGIGFGEEREDLLCRFAMEQARAIVRDEKESIDQVAERLIGGAATVGDLISYLEGWEDEI